MKKIIDLAQIEARERELEDELTKLRAIKKYATKFGSDYGPGSANGGNGEIASATPADVMQALKNVLGLHGTEEFNYQTIEQALANSGQRFSRSSIFDALATFKKNGEIDTIRAGAGRRPAQYKVTDKFSPF